MVSRTLLSAIGITVWTAVLVTAAPRAISHRHDFSNNGHDGVHSPRRAVRPDRGHAAGR